MVERRVDEERQKVPQSLRLGFLVSNKSPGSDFQVTVDAIEEGILDAQAELVVSDRFGAAAIAKADDLGVIAEVMDYFNPRRQAGYREAYGARLGKKLNLYRVEVAVLAGFSTILPPDYFETFKGVTINIHPGILPNGDGSPFILPDGSEGLWNKGLMTSKAVEQFLEQGQTYAGATIHIATEEADLGAVLGRVIVPVEPTDTLDTLYQKIKAGENSTLVAVLNDGKAIFEKAGKKYPIETEPEGSQPVFVEKDNDEADWSDWYDILPGYKVSGPIEPLYITNTNTHTTWNIRDRDFGSINEAFDGKLADEIKQRIRSSEKPLRVLDIGSGPGAECASEIANYPGVDVTAVDVYKYKGSEDSPNFRMVLEEAGSLTIPQESFDVIYTFQVFQENEELKEKGLAEIAKLLAPGGVGFVDFTKAGVTIGYTKEDIQNLSSLLGVEVSVGTAVFTSKWGHELHNFLILRRPQ